MICLHLDIISIMVSNSILIINQTNQLHILNTEIHNLTPLQMKMLESIPMTPKNLTSMSMHLILNSKDMLKFSTLIMIIIWFCINAKKQLNILIKNQEREFQHSKLGTVQPAQALTSHHGHRLNTSLEKTSLFNQDTLKMSRYYGDQESMFKNMMKNTLKV